MLMHIKLILKYVYVFAESYNRITSRKVLQYKTLHRNKLVSSTKPTTTQKVKKEKLKRKPQLVKCINTVTVYLVF